MARTSSLERLFSPIRIGSMDVRNRLVMSPMTTDYGTADQRPSDRLIRYLEARAKGGVGLLTVEVCTIDPQHRYQPHSLTLGTDEVIADHRRLTEACHRHGARVQPQISHPGPESKAPFYADMPSIGPSVCINTHNFIPCRALAIDEMPAIIDQYGQAGRRALAAGYDGIELHAAHGYMLLGSFLSPFRNKRTDDYTGATRDGRLKLLLAVVREIKRATDGTLPITLRIAGYERLGGARDLDDTQQIAPVLVEAGVDAFHISSGSDDKLCVDIIPGSSRRDGFNVALAAAVKQVVDVPVMVVGRIHHPELAEQILANGMADMIVMGRPLLADPDLPNKARAGQLAEIRRCISCQNCMDSMMIAPLDSNMNCAVNAQSGRETTISLAPAARSKHVLVIGGGTGGMEAARVAALRGHRVTLWEQGRAPGRLAVLCGHGSCRQ